MFKINHLIILLIGLFLIQFQSGISQSFSFYGGIKPSGNVKGTHLSIKTDLPYKNKWKYAVEYSLIRFTDSWFAVTDSTNLLHIENKRDNSILDLPELKRGIPIQFREVDFKPFILIHRFSLLAGYTLLDNTYFHLTTYAGLFAGIHRLYVDHVSSSTIDITFNKGGTPRTIYYHDYQIYRDLLLGPAVRIDAEYKLFENVYIGLDIQAYLNIQGGADYTIGIGGSYLF